MAIAPNHFLVPAENDSKRSVLAVFSIWVLEIHRDSQARLPRNLAKSCAGFLLHRCSRFVAWRRSGESRRIGFVAKRVPHGMVRVRGNLFRSIFDSGFLRRKKGGLEIFPHPAHCVRRLPFILRARISSGSLSSSRMRAAARRRPEHSYGNHTVILHSRLSAPAFQLKLRFLQGGCPRGRPRI